MLQGEMCQGETAFSQLKHVHLFDDRTQTSKFWLRMNGHGTLNLKSKQNKFQLQNVNHGTDFPAFFWLNHTLTFRGSYIKL